jgi:triosephosphate isomerase (TIM)
MPRPLVFAANWKMHLAPDEVRLFASQFTAGFAPRPERSYWFFPSAVSIESAAAAFRGVDEVRVGAQDLHWEPKGAFTGAVSVGLAKGAGASLALVGHSERRHVFGETDAETGRKVRAALAGGLIALLCVGEKLEERESGMTETVVLRQLHAGIADLDPSQLAHVAVAYEPVWAIGTGRTATPTDASSVHRAVRKALAGRGHLRPSILYGGSVSEGNVAALIAETEVDGVLVGGASLDPLGWRRMVETP